MLTFLVGGARSGKSSLALEIAGRTGRRVTFIATALPLDAELVERIDRHRAERPSAWETVEEAIDLEAAFAGIASDHAVIVDCLTLWIANLFDRGLDDDEISEQARLVASVASRRNGPVVVVSNEVGSGIVPADALSRRYRDTLGRVNAAFAAFAQDAYLVVAGRVLRLGEVEMPDERPRRPPR